MLSTNQHSGAFPLLQARFAGILYLIVIIAGAFAEIFVRQALVVSGDVAATANNILTHELRFRLGFSAEIIACVCNMPLAVIFYNLFRVVNKSFAMLVVFLMLVGTAIECVAVLNHFAPLFYLSGQQYLSAFTPAQLQVQAYLSLRSQSIGFAIALVFFGFYCLVLGWLIVKSTFLPRIIGVLLIIEGIGYLANSFSLFVVPSIQPGIFKVFAVTAIAELALCLWLLIKGVNVARWNVLNEL